MNPFVILLQGSMCVYVAHGCEPAALPPLNRPGSLNVVSQVCRCRTLPKGMDLTPWELERSSLLTQGAPTICTDGSTERLSCGLGDKRSEIGLKGIMDWAHRGLHSCARGSPACGRGEERAKEASRDRRINRKAWTRI